jgi:hypothetical protein
VEEPADVGGELLGFGAGEEEAVVEGVEEARVIDPFAAFDELAVHECDLPDGAAEAEEADFQPDGNGLAEAGRI